MKEGMKTIAEKRFPKRPRIIFMGTPEFAIPSLRCLISEGHEILSVVTQPDRPEGRGKKIAFSPVKKLALEHNMLILQPEKVSDANFCGLIRDAAPDIIIVVAFGQILSKELLIIPKWGAINTHASLLPKYRGAAPIQRAVLNNESLTGLTIMRIDEGVDSGPILYQESVPIKKDESAGQLQDRLSGKAGNMLIRFLEIMSEGKVKETVQDHASATYASKIDKDMAMIEWDLDAQRVSSLIRALDPSPGAYTTIRGIKVKLFSPRILDEEYRDPVPGRVIRKRKGILSIETGKGTIEIGEAQCPGKKRLPSKDFLMGFPLAEGAILGK
ncbi:MAG TPA: methionyl-tRNA formyltransferase [Desulfatiglandales bacterium]|nr:methionyl-tRNA formyltransferase [Desulfatiglandales bacterium]